MNKVFDWPFNGGPGGALHKHHTGCEFQLLLDVYESKKEDRCGLFPIVHEGLRKR